MISFALQVTLDVVLNGLSKLDNLSSKLGAIEDQIAGINLGFKAAKRGMDAFTESIEPAVLEMGLLSGSARVAANNAKMPDLTHFISQINEANTAFQHMGNTILNNVGASQKINVGAPQGFSRGRPGPLHEDRLNATAENANIDAITRNTRLNANAENADKDREQRFRERQQRAQQRASDRKFDDDYALAMHENRNRDIIAGKESGGSFLGSALKGYAGFVGLQYGGELVHEIVKSGADMQDQRNTYALMGYTPKQTQAAMDEQFNNPVAGLPMREAAKVRLELEARYGRGNVDNKDVSDYVILARANRKIEGSHSFGDLGTETQALVQMNDRAGLGGAHGGKIDKRAALRNAESISQIVRVLGGKYNTSEVNTVFQKLAPQLEMKNGEIGLEDQVTIAAAIDKFGPRAGDILARDYELANKGGNQEFIDHLSSLHILNPAMYDPSHIIGTNPITGKPRYDKGYAVLGAKPGDFDSQSRIIQNAIENKVRNSPEFKNRPESEIQAEIGRQFITTFPQIAGRGAVGLTGPAAEATKDNLRNQLLTMPKTPEQIRANLDGLNDATLELSASFEKMSGAVGYTFVSQLTGLTNMLTRVTDAVGKTSNDHPILTSVATYAGEGALAILGLAGLIKGFSLLSKLMVGVGSQYAKAGTLIMDSAEKAAIGLSKLTSTSAARSVLSGAKMAAVPIGLIAMAGSMVSEAIMSHLPDFKGKETISSAIDYGTMGAAVGELVGGPWGAAIGALIGTVTGLIIPNLDAFGKALSGTTSKINDWQDRLLKGIHEFGHPENQVSKDSPVIWPWQDANKIMHDKYMADHKGEFDNAASFDAATMGALSKSDKVLHTPLGNIPTEEADKKAYTLIPTRPYRPAVTYTGGKTPDLYDGLYMEQGKSFPTPGNNTAPFDKTLSPIPYQGAIFPPSTGSVEGGSVAPKQSDLYLNDIYAKSIIVDSNLFAGELPAKTVVPNYTVSPLLGGTGFQSAPGEPDVHTKPPSVPGVTTSSIPQSDLNGQPTSSMAGGGVQSEPDVMSSVFPADPNVPASGFGEGMKKAPEVMKSLMSDLNLTAPQAAGIVGNLAHETGGFKQMQEINPRGGRGGFGWAQWTGPRRTAFENYAKSKGLDPRSDKANLGFLEYELTHGESKSLSAVKGARTEKESASIFEKTFERSGVPAITQREQYASKALQMYGMNAPAPIANNDMNTAQSYPTDLNDPSLMSKITRGIAPANDDKKLPTGNENNVLPPLYPPTDLSDPMSKITRGIAPANNDMKLPPLTGAAVDLHNPLVMANMVNQNMINQGLSLNGMNLSQPPDASSLEAKSPTGGAMSVPNQTQSHVHDIKVHLDGEQIGRSVLETQFDWHPAASSGTTGYDWRMGAMTPGTSIRG